MPEPAKATANTVRGSFLAGQGGDFQSRRKTMTSDLNITVRRTLPRLHRGQNQRRQITPRRRSASSLGLAICPQGGNARRCAATRSIADAIRSLRPRAHRAQHGTLRSGWDRGRDWLWPDAERERLFVNSTWCLRKTPFSWVRPKPKTRNGGFSVARIRKEHRNAVSQTLSVCVSGSCSGTLRIYPNPIRPLQLSSD